MLIKDIAESVMDIKIYKVKSIEHRNNCFDIIRLFAAITVIISHQYSLSGMSEPIFLGMSKGEYSQRYCHARFLCI